MTTKERNNSTIKAYDKTCELLATKKNIIKAAEKITCGLEISSILRQVSNLDVIRHCLFGERSEVTDVTGQLLKDRIFAMEARNAWNGLLTVERIFLVPERL